MAVAAATAARNTQWGRGRAGPDRRVHDTAPAIRVDPDRDPGRDREPGRAFRVSAPGPRQCAPPTGGLDDAVVLFGRRKGLQRRVRAWVFPLFLPHAPGRRGRKLVRPPARGSSPVRALLTPFFG